MLQISSFTGGGRLSKETIWAIGAPLAFAIVLYAGFQLGEAINDGAGPWLAVSLIASIFACFSWFGGDQPPTIIIVLQVIFLTALLTLTGYRLFV